MLLAAKKIASPQTFSQPVNRTGMAPCHFHVQATITEDLVLCVNHFAADSIRELSDMEVLSNNFRLLIAVVRKNVLELSGPMDLGHHIKGQSFHIHASKFSVHQKCFTVSSVQVNVLRETVHCLQVISLCELHSSGSLF